MQDQDPTDDLFVFNGVDGATGGYALAPMPAGSLLDLARGQPVEDIGPAPSSSQDTGRGIKDGFDPTFLGDAGWAVVFPARGDPAIQEALRPLLEHRKAQATARDERRYRELCGPTGYRPDERKQRFLTRLGAASAGAVNPDRMPYYILLVGSPEEIPWEFQAQLDLQYAVGRIHFDTVEDYAQYARSVVAAETRPMPRAPRLTLFGSHNADDRATALSATHLIAGLHEGLSPPRPGWTVDKVVAEEATRAGLTRLLSGPDAPSLLFTATHGVSFPSGDPRQAPHQGALLCQDWPGPLAWHGPLPPDHYFSADDIHAAANLHGMIMFSFACYGGGTPEFDAFQHIASPGERRRLAPRPFVARLPSRLLAHPGGGALAVVSHVDRAWSCSFFAGGTGPELETYAATLERLLGGGPIGFAMELFGVRYAELSSDLAAEFDAGAVDDGARPSDVAGMWTACNDARNFMIFGDPAVRLP